MKKIFNRDRRFREEDSLMDDLEYMDEEYYEEGMTEESYEETAEEETFYEGTSEEEYAEDEIYYEDGEISGDAEYYEGEEGAADGIYYEDGEGAADETYYEGEEGAGNETYYEDEEGAVDGIYYEDGEAFADEAYYESEESAVDEALYEDEAFFESEEDAGEEEFFEMEDLSEDGPEYDEDEEKEKALAWNAMYGKNIFQKLWYKLLHMSTMDKIVATTGVLVLVMALVTGTVYASTRFLDKQAVSFDTVGSQLDGVTLVGEQGLTAVADAEMARLLAAGAIEEGNKEYEEEEYTKEVTVAINMTSIEKDLKVKFVNSRTNKLIANVPFSISVKTPDGKTEIWTDDDMDGIIYKTGITPGNYSVSMIELTDSKYKDYIISTEAEKVAVRKEIAYQKVDVSDEIKDESEIDSKKEDTKEKDTEVESVLTDTVAWVESTKTTLGVTYTAVPKTQVPAPLATARSTSFMRTAAVTMGNLELTEGGTGSAAVTAPADVTFENVSYTSSDQAVAVVDANGQVTAVKAGTATITFTATGKKTDDTVSGGTATETYTGSCTVTVKAAPPQTVPVTGITLDKQTLSLKKDETAQLTAAVAPDNATDKSIEWKSADETIAKVDASGKVTALKAGTTTITVTSGSDANIKATCTVTVTEAADTRNLTLSQTALTVLPNTAQTFTATIGNSVTGGDVTGTITAKSDNTAVADAKVDIVNGKATITVTGKAVGTAKITVAIDGTAISQICTVTVGNRTMTLDKTTVSVLTGGSADCTAVIDGTGGTVTVETTDAKIATAKVAAAAGTDGKTTAKVTVSGVAAGSATITVIYKENGVELKKTFTVTVVAGTNFLKMADGKQLWVLKPDNSYREATYADYYDAAITTFYLQSGETVKYTGWQTLDGKVYYFDASGKKVTGEQVIQGAKYNFASDGSLVAGNGSFGIDVSKWNGTIDWNAVKNSGVSYVIIRCGYRGSSTGALIEDPKFQANIKGATAAGIKVGVYFFSQAVNRNEAVEEASMVLQLIKNYKISYPVFLDVESSGGRADGIDKATRTDVIKAFCETIQNSGYTAGVYANKNWLTTKIDASQLSRYKIWLAQYASTPTYTGRYDMWQYKSTGRVTGISGNVDLNLSYLGY